MNNFKQLVHDKDLCSWCHDDIINEVYVIAINKTYCRPECMVSDIKWARSFVKEEQDDIDMNNDLALIRTDKMYI